MNVFELAMKMEEIHQAFYEKLASEADSGELQTIFNLLASSEREHFGHLKEMKSGADPRLMRPMTFGRWNDVIEGMMANLRTDEALRGDADGYRHAIREEEKSIRMYEELAKQEPDQTVRELLRGLADEERQHLQVIENIYEFVEAPHSYLEWREFSNLHPL